MKTYKSLALIGLAAAALFASQAFATTCPTGTAGSPVCIAPVGSDGGGTGLQDQLDGMTTNPGDIDVYNGQTSPSSYWSILGSHASENTLVLEIAGNANSNTFGIFDPTDPSHQLKLFDGGATTNWSTKLQYFADGTYKATYFDADGNVTGQNSASFGVTNLFGYYLGVPDGVVPGNTFYSDASLNEMGGTTYPNGMAHMAAYYGDGSTSLTYGGYPAAAFGPGEYLLAWEDQAWGNSDLDYNDFVVLVESVRPVPEPAVLGMFGLGILLIGGFAATRRRKYNV